MENYFFDAVCPVCRREGEQREYKKRLAKAEKERRVVERALAMKEARR
jgi:predicted DCC family thiol-disulfide oxidoreductase YuxK